MFQKLFLGCTDIKIKLCTDILIKIKKVCMYVCVYVCIYIIYIYIYILVLSID